MRSVLSTAAEEIWNQMQEGMRLVVPVGDNGIHLTADPRYPHLKGNADVQVPYEIARELIAKNCAGEIPPWSTLNFVGMDEMFAGHEASIPEGAKVFSARAMKMVSAG